MKANHFLPICAQAYELYLDKKGSQREISKMMVEEHNLNMTPNNFRNNYLAPYIKSLNENPDDPHAALRVYCKWYDIPVDNVSVYWHKGEMSVLTKKSQIPTYTELRDGLIEEMKGYAPKYDTLVREYLEMLYADNDEAHCLVVDPADVHIGKLSMFLGKGTEYNNEVAVKRVFQGVRGLLKKASGFKVDKIVLVAGNDILHVDSKAKTTTSGTPQDTDGMWFNNFQIAKKLYIDIIEILTIVADVHVVFNPSNHDLHSGYFLLDAVCTWFKDNPHVTFDNDIRHRKYFQYFSNLIGTSHGDGAKPEKLPLLMADEAATEWGSTKHRYFYIHHFHHKMSKDYGSVCVESLRSPSGTDWWHHMAGYQGSPKAIEAFIHSKEHGQIARFTHIF